MADVANSKKSSPVLIAAAWILVVLPALWGLNFTGTERYEDLRKARGTSQHSCYNSSEVTH